MSPRPRLPRTQWNEDNIRVEVKPASLSDEPANQEVFEACLAEMNEVRMRLMVGCYGPGTVTKPKPAYRWLLGESATIHCKNLETADWFREQLLAWLKFLDGVRLEAVEDEAADGLS
jgi:hypothetical protein